MMFDKIIPAVRIICLSFLTLAITACVNDADFMPNAEGGRLQLSLANISTATTRTVPQDLGKPSAEDFHLRIVNAAGSAVYDDAFTEEEITLPIGNYTVTATFGSNPLLDFDRPYYVGQTTATVEKDQTTEASITAQVGNALISVNFGRDAEELARFNRYYSDYALQVSVGGHSLRIAKENSAQSIYVQADSHVTLQFWGKLKMEGDREVSCELASSDFPETLAAADHTVVTLTLPDPESALLVDISTVEVETVTLDETIPLSWLPVPQATATHQFDAKGWLTGTDVVFSNSYPGMKWKAVVTNADGTEVRTIEGTGELTSKYNSTNDWPYLPAGKYKATYSLVYEDGTSKVASSREFMVPAPVLSLNVSGYTNYDRYLAGDIDGANALDGRTIYEPTVQLGVSGSLLTNKNYSYTFSYTYDGATSDVTAGSNTFTAETWTDQTVQADKHVLTATATFGGVTVSGRRDFIITGLPYALNLAEHDEWTSSGGVDWFENDVRLGHLSTGSQYIQTTSSVCIPPSTRFCADYHVNVHTFTVGTYFSLTVGNLEIFKHEEGGTPFRDTDHLVEGTTATFHDDMNYCTSIRCYNDYGAGQTCSHIYYLTLKYAQP